MPARANPSASIGSPQFETVPLTELVDAAVAPYQARTEPLGIRLRVVNLPDVDLRVDRLQMEVVLRSLLTYAFDAVADSPRHPRRIAVSGWMEGAQFVGLKVEDSGLGFNAEQVNRIFDPQEGAAHSHGFGLAISRAIVVTHGGRLWAEAGNHGIFKLELRVADPNGAPAPTEMEFGDSDR